MQLFITFLVLVSSILLGGDKTENKIRPIPSDIKDIRVQISPTPFESSNKIGAFTVVNQISVSPTPTPNTTNETSENGQANSNQEDSPSGAPTYRPRPACLDSNPRCMIMETPDMCPPKSTPEPTKEFEKITVTPEPQISLPIRPKCDPRFDNSTDSYCLDSNL